MVKFCLWLALVSPGFAAHSQSTAQKMKQFVDRHINRKVGRGECWDLAAEALQHAGCEMRSAYDFGQTIDRKREPLLPGDILQIEHVVLEYKRGDTSFVEQMLKHTAIVYAVKDDGVVIIAEQNGTQGRVVGLAKLNFSHVKRGRITAYRPDCR